MADKLKVTFPAEIRRVQSRKLISNDVEYTAVFTTYDGSVLNLGTIAGDVEVLITVEIPA